MPCQNPNVEGRWHETLHASSLVRLSVPLLAGEPGEDILDNLQPAGVRDGFNLFCDGGLVAGHITEPVAPDMAAQAQQLYRRLLGLIRGRHLYRVWHYMPRINDRTGRLENYRAFCRGRSLAFEEAFGPAFKRVVSAASAVGCDDHRLTMIFVGGGAVPRHVENPEQVPAYDYPQEHGPRPPSFARATVAEEGGRRFIFVSGTSAIKGHATIASDSVGEQLSCTLDNLRLISRAAGLGDKLGAGNHSRRFKIFLRHAEDLPFVRTRIEDELLRPGDRAVYLRADICRAALKIEIEAALMG
ncbi:MAG: hypothetical protein KGJ37_05555 [Verrucomicrobiota bacterium]|nr:hypothetical protein [Verrucomicrobiota bacterium]